MQKLTFTWMLWLMMLISFGSLVHAQQGGTGVNFATLGGIAVDEEALDISNTGFTIEMWIKPSNATNQGLKQVLARRGFPYQNHSWEFYLEENKLGFHMRSNNVTNSFDIESGAIIFPDRWYHVAVSIERGGNSDFTSIYVNGERVVSASRDYFMTPYLAAHRFLFMGVEWFSGTIDDIRLWSTWVPDFTIKRWMHREVNSNHPEYSGLKFNFNCNEGAGTVLTGAQGTVLQAELMADPDGNYPSFLTSDMPHVGADPAYQSYRDIQAIWRTHLSAKSGNLSFSAASVPAGSSIIFACDPDYTLTGQGLQNCVADAYDQRFNFSWRILKQGNTINLNHLEFDLDAQIDPEAYLAAGMMYGNDPADFSTNPNCPETLTKDGDTYRPSFALTSTDLAIDYLSVGFTVPDPTFTACNDPRGGIQLQVDWTAACQGGQLDNSVFGSMSGIGFHSGGTADVNEVWGTGIDWDSPGAVQAQKRDAERFVAYIPDVNAYFGLNEVNRINFIFNQGVEKEDAWAANLKDFAADGNCRDYFVLMSDITETCAQTTTSLQPRRADPALTLAPNPVSDRAVFYFANPEQKPYQVELFDLTGQRVRSYPALRGEELTILRGGLPAGLYLLILSDSEGQASSLKLTLR